MEDQQAQNQQPTTFSPAPKNTNGGRNRLKMAGFVAVVLVIGLVVMALNNTKSDKDDTKKSKDYTTSTVLDSGEVSITKDSFTPATLRIKVGQSVNWTNKDDAVHQIYADPHPTHTSIPELYSDPLNKGDSFSYTFDKKGTYSFHEEMNPLVLKGTIIVE